MFILHTLLWLCMLKAKKKNALCKMKAYISTGHLLMGTHSVIQLNLPCSVHITNNFMHLYIFVPKHKFLITTMGHSYEGDMTQVTNLYQLRHKWSEVRQRPPARCQRNLCLKPGGASLVMEELSSPNLPEAVSYKGHTQPPHKHCSDTYITVRILKIA